VGFGLGDGGDVSLKNISSLKTQGILGDLAEDANLPDTMESLDKNDFNLKSYCELCERSFNKLKGVSRHHCRKCNKSVCQQCSNNKRKLSKADEELFRVCDFCDTILSNFKLEQNQKTILQAQEEQMEMYMTQLQYLDQQKDLELNENEDIKRKLKAFLEKELQKKKGLENDVGKLEERTKNLAETRTELYKQLTTLERLYDDKKEERNQLKVRVQVKLAQLDDKQRELEQRDEEVKKLREKVDQIKQRQNAQKLVGGESVFEKFNNNREESED